MWQRLTGAASSVHLSTNAPGTALPAGAGSPTAGMGLHAKEALGDCSVAMMHSQHTTMLLPGQQESKDICMPTVGVLATGCELQGVDSTVLTAPHLCWPQESGCPCHRCGGTKSNYNY